MHTYNLRHSATGHTGTNTADPTWEANERAKHKKKERQAAVQAEAAKKAAATRAAKKAAASNAQSTTPAPSERDTRAASRARRAHDECTGPVSQPPLSVNSQTPSLSAQTQSHEPLCPKPHHLYILEELVGPSSVFKMDYLPCDTE